MDELNLAFPGLLAGVCKASDLPSDADEAEYDDDLEGNGLLSDFVFLSDGWSVRVDYDRKNPDLCLGLSAGNTEAPADGLEVDPDDGEEIPAEVLTEAMNFISDERPSA